MLNKISFFFILISFCLSGESNSLFCLSIREKIEAIPIQDRKILTDFFKGMLSQGDFAATLLDSKPASLHSWGLWFIQRMSKKNAMRHHLLLTYQGWRTWQKYASQFSKGKLVFYSGKYRDQMFSLWLVKKNQINKVIKFCNQQPKGIEKHKELGSLLGYPKQDVEGFSETKNIELLKQYFPFEDVSFVNPVQKIIDVADLLKKYSLNLTERINFFEENFRLRKFCSAAEPFFPTAIHGCQSFTQSLNQEEEWKQKIADLYNSDHFLEEFLTLLVGDEV